MTYAVRAMRANGGTTFTVRKNKALAWSGRNYDNLIQYLKNEEAQTRKLGIRFNLNCSIGSVREDVYSYEY